MLTSFQTCKNDMRMLQVLFTRITRTLVQRVPVSIDTRNSITQELSKTLKGTYKTVSCVVIVKWLAVLELFVDHVF